MSRRTERVEELLRREIADVLLRGELRDPRLAPAVSISITGARVSADLSHARIFVDVMPLDPSGGPRPGEASAERGRQVLAGFAASAGLLRAKLQRRVELRRVPELRFEIDTGVEQGARIEAVLAELRAEPGADGVDGVDGVDGGQSAADDSPDDSPDPSESEG